MRSSITSWLAGLVCLALGSSAAYGKSPGVDDTYLRFSELDAQGPHEEASPYVEGVFLHNLASLYHNQGKNAEAEPLYAGSLVIYEKGPGIEAR